MRQTEGVGDARREPFDNQRHTLAASLRNAMAQCAAQKRQLEHDWNTIYRRFRRWSETGICEAVSVTLAENMADSGRKRGGLSSATRYDQPAQSFLSMVQIAAAKYWLKFVRTA
jgi:transposase